EEALRVAESVVVARRTVAVAVELLAAEHDLVRQRRQRVAAIPKRAEFGLATGEVSQRHNRYATDDAGARRECYGPAADTSERECTRDGPGERDLRAERHRHAGHARSLRRVGLAAIHDRAGDCRRRYQPDQGHVIAGAPRIGDDKRLAAD